MDLLKIYEKGENYMAADHFIGRLHRKMSQLVMQRSDKQFIRKNVRIGDEDVCDPTMAAKDAKERSMCLFFGAGSFCFLGVCLFMSLDIVGVLFSFAIAFVLYAFGVMYANAPQIEKKTAECSEKSEINIEKQGVQISEQTKKKPLWVRLLILLKEILFIWVIYLAFWKPEEIQRFVAEYKLYDYVKSLGIKESNIGGVFGLCVVLAYFIIVRVVMVLFSFVRLITQKKESGYSLEGVARPNRTDVNRKRQ